MLVPTKLQMEKESYDFIRKVHKEPLAKVPQGVIPAGFFGWNPGFKVPGPRLAACRGDGI